MQLWKERQEVSEKSRQLQAELASLEQELAGLQREQAGASSEKSRAQARIKALEDGGWRGWCWAWGALIRV
jgi:outer membrane murein-binding lipoprotein Lpp